MHSASYFVVVGIFVMVRTLNDRHAHNMTKYLRSSSFKKLSTVFYSIWPVRLSPTRPQVIDFEEL